MVDVAIKIENLTKDYKTIRAVDEISLEVPSGILFGLLGPNGSGKTTMIKLLLGILEPTSGRANVLGFDIIKEGEEIRKRAGALLEYSGLYERLSAEDNLELYGRIYKMPADERKERIKELLLHIGLWERRKEPVIKWSRGMKQKLAVARSILHHPSIVFLDEPTAGLDPVAAANLRDDLLALVSSESATIFLNTHNLSEAEKLCKRIGVINKGKLIAVGSPGELKSLVRKPRIEVIGRGFNENIAAALRDRPEVSMADVREGSIIVDLHDGADVSSLVEMIVNHGGKIEEVRKDNASLEEAFISLVDK